MKPLPLVADPRVLDHETRRAYVRAATAVSLSGIRKSESAEQILLRHWPNDRAAETIVRGTTAPLKLADYPAPTGVGALLMLAPRSASVRLFELAAAKIDLTGIASISFPLASNFTAAAFVAEGEPIRVGQGSFSGMQVGPTKKIALIGALSDELENASPEAASIPIGHVLEIAVGNGMDAAVFSNAAADATRPAGLLFGATLITPPTSGGGVDAMVADLKKLVSAIAAAGVDPESVVFIAAPAQAVALRLQSGPNFAYRLLGANIPNGTVIAVASVGLVVAGSGLPTIETSKQSSLHLDDTAPVAVIEGTPTRSLFQSSTLALRCIARVTWAAAPGSVAYLTGATW